MFRLIPAVTLALALLGVSSAVAAAETGSFGGVAARSGGVEIRVEVAQQGEHSDRRRRGNGVFRTGEVLTGTGISAGLCRRVSTRTG